MRTVALFLIALCIIPGTASPQVSVTAPAAGAQSSYRATVITWDPIPGASSYHLEIDDDPSFGSPEVDVTVAGTSYTLSGERLKLHGQLSWAAYVRINGVRWNAGTFSPSYFSSSGNPALGVDSQNRVYLAFTGPYPYGVYVTTSNDWSSLTLLSAPASINTGFASLAVDENEVAHAFWTEDQTGAAVPRYANSSTGWNVVPIPGTVSTACSESSMIATRFEIDVFINACWEGIDRLTSSDGLQFTRTRIPNNATATSVSAARDAAGNLFIASERDTIPEENLHSSLQTSADGWIPHRLGPGRFPSIAVTPGSDVHALRWGFYDWNGSSSPIWYSNSLRGFDTWTEVARVPHFEQDILPLVVDDTRGELHAAVLGDNGLQLCSAANTGQAADTGTSWTCVPVGQGPASRADLAVAPEGTLHLAWNSGGSMGYANSLGSFLATNFTPQLTFGAPSSTASAAIVPAHIADADGDGLRGHIHVGRFQRVISMIEPGTSEPILHRRYALTNFENSYLHGPEYQLEFRPMGSTGPFSTVLSRNQLPALPAIIEFRRLNRTDPGSFVLLAWDNAGAAILQMDFVSAVELPYGGQLPGMIDISTLPEGDAFVGIAVSDGSTSSFGAQMFTKAPGQTQLVLTPSGP